MSALVHRTAIVEDGVDIGQRTSVWDSVHVRGPSSIGNDCIIGEKTYIAYGVSIADRVKINAHVYICTGVTLETGVMVSAGVTFTNDRFPRATTPDLAELRSSEPDEDTLSTRVGEGATLGARAVIGPGLTIGRFAMVGMGSVVTRPVSDHHLVVGNPAHVVGVVCRCGQPVHRGRPETMPGRTACPQCGRLYEANGDLITEVRPG